MIDVVPIAAVEVEAAYVPNEEEGNTGFAVRRMLLGVAWRPDGPFEGEASVNAVGDHGPTLWDATIGWRNGPLSVHLGYAQAPQFPTVHQTRDSGPLPELSLTAAAFWPGRDTGVEVRLAGTELPIDVRARVGNGSDSPLGNDNPMPSADGRADLVLGRARSSDASDVAGLRVGVGGHLEEAMDGPGIAGTLPTGFTFWRPPTVSGRVAMGEAHLIGSLGSVAWTTEAALSVEGRSIDDDGDPDTDRVRLDPVRAYGGTTELAWMVTGQRRVPGAWPVVDGLGVEVATRASRLVLGRGADDVAPGGAALIEAAAHLWWPSGVGASLTGAWASYDEPPLEAPDVSRTGFVAVRASARL